MTGFLPRHAARWRTWLVVGEGVVLLAAVYAGIALRYITTEDPLHAYVGGPLALLRACVFAALILLGLTALGLHQAQLRESWFGMLARQTVAFLLSWIGLVVMYYLFPPLHIGRGVLLLALLFGYMGVAAFRWLIERLVDISVLQRRILVLGAGQRASSIIERMRRRADRRGFVLTGFVARQDEVELVPAVRIIRPETSLREWTESKNIDEIVVAVDDRRGGLPMDDLLACREHGVDIIELSTFFERESGRLQLGLTDPSWLVFSEGFDASPLRRFSKRGFDISMAMLLGCGGMPFMLLTALAIMLESGSRRALLYRQQRVGERGRLFNLIKFRSMSTDAESDGVARWAQKNDARVTRVGRFIRKTRLDELPQLWNVLHGDMSFIGPRPERPEFVAQLSREIRYYQLRHAVKPGLAGWAQLRYPYGASVRDAEEKLKYDLFYVKNHNLLFDLMILIQTVEIILFGRGVR